MKALYINTNRLGYTPEQCPRTMTEGDLIDYLSEFDEDRRGFLRNDKGYTYSTVDERENVMYANLEEDWYG